MKNITKEVFLNTAACPTLGWTMVNEEEGEMLFSQLACPHKGYHFLC